MSEADPVAAPSPEEMSRKKTRARLFFVPEVFRNFDYPAMTQRLRAELPALREVVVVRGRAAGCREYGELLQMGTGRQPLERHADPNAVKLVL